MIRGLLRWLFHPHDPTPPPPPVRLSSSEERKSIEYRQAEIIARLKLLGVNVEVIGLGAERQSGRRGLSQ